MSFDKQAVLKTSNSKYLTNKENVFVFNHEPEIWDSLENNTSNVCMYGRVHYTNIACTDFTGHIMSNAWLPHTQLHTLFPLWLPLLEQVVQINNQVKKAICASACTLKNSVFYFVLTRCAVLLCCSMLSVQGLTVNDIMK